MKFGRRRQGRARCGAARNPGASHSEAATREGVWGRTERRCELIDDLEAHLAGGAGDDAEAGFVTARVQVFGFRFHDVYDLSNRFPNVFIDNKIH
jgi:hypothetical protein